MYTRARACMCVCTCACLGTERGRRSAMASVAHTPTHAEPAVSALAPKLTPLVVVCFCSRPGPHTPTHAEPAVSAHAVLPYVLPRCSTCQRVVCCGPPTCPLHQSHPWPRGKQKPQGAQWSPQLLALLWQHPQLRARAAGSMGRRGTKGHAQGHRTR